VRERRSLGRAGARAALAAPPRRGPGRPPRLSRERILDAALALLEREPAQPLTVARIAEEVGAVPAALYRHFAGLDELLDGVLARVLAGVALELRPRAPWRTQLREWMQSLRRHLLRYPAALRIIGRRGRTSPAWLDAASAQVAILERAGLSGAELARAHLWVLETVVGMVMQEASLALPEQIEAARSSLPAMSAEGRAHLAPLVPHLARLDPDTFFGFVTERTLVALEGLVDRIG
jgi:AcrR family transcriptional regulator